MVAQAANVGEQAAFQGVWAQAEQARAILLDKFGGQAFRPLQHEMIRGIVQHKKSVYIHAPAGFGKRVPG